MPFGRTGKQNNRSQHNLVGPTVGAGNPGASTDQVSAVNAPPPASSNTAFSSSESFDAARPTQSQPPQPPQPPQHTVNIYTGAPGGGNGNGSDVSQLHHSNTISGGAYDSRRKDTDFADLVARSQSHRFPQQISPIQTQQQQQIQQLQQQQHYGQASGSVDNLHDTLNIASPVGGQGPPPQQHQQLPQAPPPKKQSTRKLIKNILTGQNNRGAEPQQHGPQSAYHNTGGLARRPSKRVSNPPPTIRTGISQVSLEQQPIDWQTQAPPTIPSPQQGSGEFRDSFLFNQSNQELLLQNPQDFQQNTSIRQVAPDADHSPYSAEDVGAYHQQLGHIQLQGATPELQQQQFNQATFDQQQQLQQQQQQQQQHQFASQQAQYQGNSQQLFSGHLGNPQQQNPETVSQLSHESPITDPDQRSATNAQSSQPSPAVNYPLQNPLHSLQTQDLPPTQNPHSAQSVEQAQTPQQQSMAPPPTGPPPSRRSQETEKPPPGPPPSYRHSQQPNLSNLPPPSAGGQTPGNYRQQSSLQERQGFDGASAEQGRNSPQPGSDRGDGTEDKAFKDLLTKYKNVKRLYFDGKKDIEHLSSQVEQLQNAVANQRLSQSRTSLDDSEYATRFNRLNGAINNLSFNIRKDWVTLPSWLVPYVTPEALKTGKQEMTAVGRAVISRWLVDEIFNRCFHPGLDPDLSKQLKQIEQNIRQYSYKLTSQEEYDALTSKVVAWRMTTLEGLAEVIRSPESASHKSDFTRRATSNLTACLYQHLSDPPPTGVDGSASMIVELAVAIATNMPMESRDVAITYPLPEEPVQPNIMEVEKTGLPQLETRPDGEDGVDEKDSKDGKKSRSGAPPALPPKDPGKVRFAGFVAVEVRGRQVLIKAPVWTLG
ncbi:hypothetical protein CONLIGDRAFT_677440 [Coniochaeta ligniaria NRRL 30616]|uniref:S-adenosylmethionine-dependent methyltransferase-like protein n=1 Tax=Coniochaeta ligniaria NRRL 30616 TaxID=1408157 RepID=A0A1J7JW91_9PEZI|nr:hypothetical protein CONLIGDRAFT_677440 [Coniochaeta ligniaria NRRL 30616]